jgi:hypothetical protein
MHPLARLVLVAGFGTFASAANALDFSIAPDISGGFGNYKWSVSIKGAVAVSNPPLYLRRGVSYSLAVGTDVNHPFWIKTADSTGSANRYDSGVSANGVTAFTTVTFNVPTDAPDSLHYNCGNHAEMHGPINVVIFRDGFN